MAKTQKAARVRRLLFLVVLTRPLGNLSLAWGMKHFPQIVSISPLPYLRAMSNPYVAAGILLLILSLLIRMALLSLADLSYVVPMTALGYIVSTALAQFFLQESVNAQEWMGTFLVFLGAAVVGTATRAKTTQPPGQANSPETQTSLQTRPSQ